MNTGHRHAPFTVVRCIKHGGQVQTCKCGAWRETSIIVREGRKYHVGSWQKGFGPKDSAAYKTGFERGKKDPEGTKGPSRKQAGSDSDFQKAIDYLGAVEAQKIERAVRYFGAVELENGFYAYFDPDQTWHVVHAKHLEALALALTAITGSRSKSERKALRIWRASNPESIMPAWWNLLQRTLAICEACFSLGLRREVCTSLRHPNIRRITADLQTGEEVSA